MTRRLSFLIFLIVLVSGGSYWTSPVCARLFPPCQAIDSTLDNPNTVRYGYTDPTSGQYQEETYVLSLGDERYIESVHDDQGILTWMERYRNAGEAYFTFRVQYRIYDPGRGVWKAGTWGPFAGYNTWLGQPHQVKDGVVAWTAHRTMGASPTDKLEHWVYYATYDPEFGSWMVGNDYWRVESTSKYSPEVVRVKNGVVSWPMNDATTGQASDMSQIDVFFALYDQELHIWQDAYAQIHGVDTFFYHTKFDWIEIVQDSTFVQVRFSDGFFYNHDDWYFFDPYAHEWDWNADFLPELSRHPFFVAQPTSGVAPLRVWFWDCSIALDGVPTPSSWDWIFASINNTGTDRSPTFLYSSPGQYTVFENVSYPGISGSFDASGLITALAPAPTGSISINNGATYTTAANVTLSLNYGASATEMCFRESPGLFLWGGWQPVATSKSWALSTIHPLGESPDGPHSVSVKFRDQYHTESQEYQASITLVTTPPVGSVSLNGGAATTTDPKVRASWSATSAYSMQMSYTAVNQGDSFYMWGPWENYRRTMTTIQFNSKPGRKKVMVRFKDVAGNITQTEASIQLQRVSLPFLTPLLGD